MASLDDILTTQKNGVQAINGFTNATNTLAGTNSTMEIGSASGTVTQVIKTTGGWLATVSVIVQGSTTGYFYDANNSTAANLVGTRICAIPSSLTPAVYQIQIAFANGLVLVTGTNSIVSIGYT